MIERRATSVSGALSGYARAHRGCPLLTQADIRMIEPDVRFAGPRNYFFPGGVYKLATLEALSATALNSAPVQALEVVTSEIVPAAAAANNAARADSASLVSVMSRKSASPVVK